MRRLGLARPHRPSRHSRQGDPRSTTRSSFDCQLGADADQGKVACTPAQLLERRSGVRPNRWKRTCVATSSGSSDVGSG